LDHDAERRSPPQVLILGPSRAAVSGVSTHLNELFESDLGESFCLRQYQVGSEGRVESRLDMLLRILVSPFELAARLLREGSDIVHINATLSGKGYWRDLAYMSVAKLLGRKVIFQVHGGPFAQSFFARTRVPPALLRLTLSFADVVVLLSTHHMKAYREFAPKVHLDMISYGVEIPDDVDLRLERYASPGPLRILYAGRLVPEKGLFELVEALQILRTRRVEVRMTFVGSGPLEPALRRKIVDAGLDDRVEVRAPVFGAAKHEMWSRAHVLAMPTHWEGLPLALLESMAAGCVPVITPVGGIPDVVQDHVQGILISPRDPPGLADALQELHEDRQAVWRMAIAGRRRVVEGYSRSRLAEDFRRLYAQLLESERARSSV
jgi:glycosyltransferase involved in cell wall biosynthesis